MKKYWIISEKHFLDIMTDIDRNTSYIWKAGQMPLEFTPEPNQYPYILIIDNEDNRMSFSSDLNFTTSVIYKSKQIGYVDVEEYKLQTNKEKLIEKLKDFKI